MGKAFLALTAQAKAECIGKREDLILELQADFTKFRYFEENEGETRHCCRAIG